MTAGGVIAVVLILALGILGVFLYLRHQSKQTLNLITKETNNAIDDALAQEQNRSDAEAWEKFLENQQP